MQASIVRLFSTAMTYSRQSSLRLMSDYKIYLLSQASSIFDTWRTAVLLLARTNIWSIYLQTIGSRALICVQNLQRYLASALKRQGALLNGLAVPTRTCSLLSSFNKFRRTQMTIVTGHTPCVNLTQGWRVPEWRTQGTEKAVGKIEPEGSVLREK